MGTGPGSPAGWGQSPAAPALTLWQILAHRREIVLVDVELGWEPAHSAARAARAAARRRAVLPKVRSIIT